MFSDKCHDKQQQKLIKKIDIKNENKDKGKKAQALIGSDQKKLPTDSVRLARIVAHECGPAARATPTKWLTQKQRQAAQSITTKTKRAAQLASEQVGAPRSTNAAARKR